MDIFKDLTIYKIMEKDEYIGAVEFNEKDRYIENIFIDEKYRGKGYLRKIINYLGKPLVALPLPQHIEKFKHLGFKIHKIEGDDVFYILK